MTTANIIQGTSFAVSHGARVINMSLSSGPVFDQAFSDAISNTQANDVVVVVAAGGDPFAGGGTIVGSITGVAISPVASARAAASDFSCNPTPP